MKQRLNQLAKEFDLKFNKNWFNYIWISKEENVFLEYMWMCPDPIFSKYGETTYVPKHLVDEVQEATIDSLKSLYGKRKFAFF